MKKIYVDFDSTLNNLDEEWCNWVNHIYNGNITPFDIKHWDWMGENFPNSNAFWKNPEIYNELITPKEGAFKFIQELENYFEVIILSTSYPGTEKAKDDNIKKYFGDIKVIHTKDKSIYTKDSILIDDKPSTVNNHCRINNCIGIVYDEDYKFGWSKLSYKNVKEPVHYKLCVARNYNEIFRILLDIPVY